MFQEDYYIVFPEGDVQEISGRIPMNSMVDMNGRPLALPLPTNKMIVFRVQRVRTVENKGISETFHYLELVSSDELLGLVKNSRTVVDDSF
ncbi:MAG: hypothetical protein LBI67_08715 [Treponema sp.]|jgi:hypothetical protein|nr:hypothetical protein [Treponema sp.]